MQSSEFNSKAPTSPLSNVPAQNQTYILKYLFLIPALLVLTPLILFKLKSSDWNSYSYFVEYFKNHLLAGKWPEFINNNAVFGNLQVLLYGVLFNPLAGMLAILTGTDTAMRLIVCAVTILPAWLSYRITVKLTGHYLLAFLFCTLLLVSQYGLSNLYFRMAIPEYIACGLTLSGILAFLTAWLPENQNQQMGWYNFAAILLTLSAGTHPITFMLTFAFLVITLPVTLALMKINQQRILVTLRKMLPFLLLAFLSLFYFIYLQQIVGQSAKIGGSTDFHRFHLDLFIHIDEVLFKLLPLAGDYRSYAAGIKDVQTPFLKAPVEILQFVLAVWLLCKFLQYKPAKYRITTIILFVFLSVCAFGLVIILSNPAWCDLIIPQTLFVAQFAFRFTTYLNLFFTLSIILLLFTIAQNKINLLPGRHTIILIVLITLSYMQLYMRFTELMFLKYYQSHNVQEAEFNYNHKGEWNEWSGLPYSYADFADIHRFPLLEDKSAEVEISPTLPQIPPGTTRLEMQYECKKPLCWLGTRVLPSRFLQVQVDGDLPEKDSIFLNPMFFVTLKLPAGKHVINFTNTLTPEIRQVRIICYTIWFGWLIASLGWWLFRRNKNNSHLK